MTIKSGKLIDGYVLAAWNKDVSFGTIILPEKDGWKAETDIAIFGNSARTRTLISQSFKPTLSQHYASLMDAVDVAGKGEAYAKLKEMLNYVSDVVKRDLKEFDRVVESSKATVTVYGSGVGVLSEQYVDSVSVTAYAPTEPSEIIGSAVVHGEYTSWRNDGSDKITLNGWFSISASGYVEYEMHRPNIRIDGNSIRLTQTSGWGWITNQVGGDGENRLGYSTLGVAQWALEFSTDWFERLYPNVIVDVEAIAGGDSGQQDDTLLL